MNEFLIIMGFILVVSGLTVAVWSLIDTRKKYYKEYIDRRDGDAEN